MPNLEGNTPLHEAVMNGHKENVALMIGVDPSLASVTNNAGDSPMFLAVDGNFFDIAIHILEHGSNCSFKGRKGMTVLHVAAIRTEDKTYWSHLRTMGLTTVQSTSCGGFIKKETSFNAIVDELLRKHGTHILHEKDDEGWMPHHYAAHLGNVEMLNRILETGNEDGHNSFDYKVDDEEGMSALHIAARNEQVRVIELLINKYPQISEILDNRNRTALHVAVESGKTDVVKALLKMMNPDDINRKDKDGNTCLHLAAACGHVTMLIKLANEKKVDKNAINKSGRNAIDVCESNRNLGPLTTVVTTAILRKRGTIPSLETVVTRGTKKACKKTSHVPKENVPAKDNDISKESNENSGTNAMHVCESSGQLGPHATEDVPANAKESTDIKAKTSSPTEIEEERQPAKKGHIFSQEDINNMININLVVATIVAGVTFSAIIAMPGGYNDDGVAILGGKATFKLFLVFDSLAFSSSAALMFIHFLIPLYSKFVLDRTKAYPLSWVIWLTVGSTLSMVLAFVMCTIAVLGGKSLPPYDVGCAGIITAAVFLLPVLLFLVRRICWFVKEVTMRGLYYGICYVFCNHRY